MALVTVTSSGAEPRSYELNKHRTVFGRDTNCDVHLDNLSISKNHCEIVNENGRFVIRDLKSSNKTYVNGTEIQEQDLKNGDEIVMGNFKVTFSGAVPLVENRPKPATEEAFEPTLQLPPEMIRKKMEEMQREKEKGVSAARAAAATTATRPHTPSNPSAQNTSPAPASESGSSMGTMLVVGAIVIVVIVNVIIYMRYH